MEGLLFLAHRVPYPPTKGDKIRSFNMLNHLSRHFRVYLGAFVDDPADWSHEARLRELCHDVCLLRLTPRWRRLWSLRALLDGRPLSVAYFEDGKMRRWVCDLLRRDAVSRVLFFSSPMAQYALGPALDGAADRRTIMDFVDVDSDKWRMYGERHRGVLGWLYRREAAQLLEFDTWVANAVDASVFVSRAEADMFRGLAPQVVRPILAVENGVDTDYFSPQRAYANPFPDEDAALVFTGAMDYWANVDAVSWFVRAVFPRIRRQVPKARFFIVGARPTAEVRRLSAVDGVHVTGTVRDIRGYLHHAAIAVAPMRVARGVQNKVLEALAMARPIVMTVAAIHGIDAPGELSTLVADDEDHFARRAVELLVDRAAAERIGRIGRDFVESRYRWSEKMTAFSQLLGEGEPLWGEAGKLAMAAAGEGK